MRALLSALLLVAVSTAAARAQAPKPPTFVVTVGTDTVAVERTWRVGDTTLAAELRLPLQRTRARYVAHLRDDGSARTVDVEDDAPNFFTGTIAFGTDALGGARPEAGRRTVVAASGSYPVVGTSIALIEQLLKATHPALHDSVRLPVTNIRNRLRGAVSIARTAPDSIVVTCDGCQRRNSHQVLELLVDAHGAVQGGWERTEGWAIARE